MHIIQIKGMHKFMMLLFFWAILAASCKKDSNTPEKQGHSDFSQLSGSIYYKWADEGIFKVSFPGGNRQLFLESAIRRNNWDVSQDDQWVLECADIPGDYLASQFTITKSADRSVLKQFRYYAGEGDIATGNLSPNKQLIAINPTFHDGIVITDLDGNEIQHILTVNNEKLNENPVWMPDNTLLIPHKNWLLKTDADFTNVRLLKEFDFEQWGSPAVSPDGQFIAFIAAKHVWLMKKDGTNLRQITISSGEEAGPQFSPDGKYILVGTDWHITGPFGGLFYLKVIPADGKQYNVDDGRESAGVIPVILVGKSQLEAGDGKLRWR